MVFETIWNLFPNPTTYLTETVDLIASSGIVEPFNKFCLLIIIFGVIWGGYRIAVGGGTDELKGLMLRLILVGVLFAWTTEGECINYATSIDYTTGQQVTYCTNRQNLPHIVKQTWYDTYAWSLNKFASPALDKALVESETLGQYATGLLGIAMIAKIGGKLAVDAAIQKGVAKEIAKGGGKAAIMAAVDGYANMLSWIGLATLPLILTLFLIVMTSGMAVLFGNVLLPFFVAFMIFKGEMGVKMISTYMKIMFSSYFVALFVPALFSLALNIGFVGPAKHFNEQIIEAKQQYLKALEVAKTINPADVVLVTVDAATAGAPRIAPGASGLIDATTKKMADAVGGFFTAIGTLLIGFIISLIMMVVGLIAAIAVMNNAQQTIAAFFGGLIARAGGAPRMGRGGMPTPNLSFSGFGSLGGGGSGAQNSAGVSVSNPNSGALGSSSSTASTSFGLAAGPYSQSTSMSGNSQQNNTQQGGTVIDVTAHPVGGLPAFSGGSTGSTPNPPRVLGG